MFLASHLTIGYQTGTYEKRLYSDLNFQLQAGTLTTLIGPNGAGKSTLLRTLSGVQPVLAGSLLLNGKPLTKYRITELSQTIGLVTTERIACGGLRVEEVVAMGRHPYTGFWGRMKSEDCRIVEEAMQQTGIMEMRDRAIAELSDGERQKVMIAKILAQQCPIILLDEPTAFLDIASRTEIMCLLHDLTAIGRTILLSTHDLDQALQLSDRIWMLAPEKGLVCRTPEEAILYGDINLFFDSELSTFDQASGQFRRKIPNPKTFRLEAPDPLAFWIENIARRYGMKRDTDSDICITATDFKDISYFESNKRKRFSSISGLADFLRLHKKDLF